MFCKTLLSIAILSTALCSAALAENTQTSPLPDPMHARYHDCLQLQEIVQDTEKDSHSSQRSAAHKIAQQADQFCHMTHYSKGVVLYERALQMLHQP